MKILLVDDEQIALDSLKRLMRRRGYKEVETCGDSEEAVKLIKQSDFDLVLLDLLMPRLDGLQVLEAVKPYKPHCEFIMLTAVDDLSTAVKALQLGAYDYLVKPVDNDRLLLVVERAYERRGLLAGLAGASSGKGEITVPEQFSAVFTKSPRMKELLSYALIMGRSGNSIMITGESGTGKELLAQGIHKASPVQTGPFVAVNVSSVSESLFESQFFGHVKGAFTGASNDYKGYFEQAEGGTLFLDEIGDLPVNLQTKFLRVLEEKTVRRLGDQKSTPVNVRIVSATNRDLDESCQNGTFRLDLFYRLKQAHIHLPPLREREGDIGYLAEYFLKKFSGQHNKKIIGYSMEAYNLLESMSFPGNVRELMSLVEHSVLICDEEVIYPRHIGKSDVRQSPFARTLCSLKEDTERHLAYVLVQTQGDRKKTAEILGVSVRHVQRRLAELKKTPQWEPLLGDI